MLSVSGAKINKQAARGFNWNYLWTTKVWTDSINWRQHDQKLPCFPFRSSKRNMQINLRVLLKPYYFEGRRKLSSKCFQFIGTFSYDAHHEHHASETPIAIAQFPGPNDLHTSLALNNRGGLCNCLETSVQGRCVCLLIDTLRADPNAIDLPSYLTLIGHLKAVNFDNS